ncbi:LysR family transcriptional regulator [Ensifer adhaerens]|uniref:LysR family transcriptional regulator n=1 Tax=Ensifer adhaerens TaxID=106592 RepID=UPI000CF0FB87|nr:LysR family transcriptional regulator [Ensifer adhaerens]
MLNDRTESLDPNFDRSVSRFLIYFSAVAEELSFSRAAARLNMSQPPLSMHIKELETLLGTQLFRRSSRSVELTAAGAVLMENTRRIQGMTRQTLRQVQLMGRGEAGHVHLGMVGSAAWGKLLPAMRQFSSQSPGMTWSMIEMTPVQQVAALQRHEIDVGMWREVRQAELPAPFTSRLIERERMFVALPIGHRLLVRERAISLVDLADEPLIMISEGPYNLGEYVAQIFRSYEIEAKVAHTVVEPQTALALVGAGDGFTLLPESYSRIAWPQAEFRALKQGVTANLFAVADPQGLNPIAHRLLEFLDADNPRC